MMKLSITNPGGDAQWCDDPNRIQGTTTPPTSSKLHADASQLVFTLVGHFSRWHTCLLTVLADDGDILAENVREYIGAVGWKQEFIHIKESHPLRTTAMVPHTLIVRGNLQHGPKCEFVLRSQQ